MPLFFWRNKSPSFHGLGSCRRRFEGVAESNRSGGGIGLNTLDVEGGHPLGTHRSSLRSMRFRRSQLPNPEMPGLSGVLRGAVGSGNRGQGPGWLVIHVDFAAGLAVQQLGMPVEAHQFGGDSPLGELGDHGVQGHHGRRVPDPGLAEVDFHPVNLY